MYQKINYREKIVGWYSSGPKIRPHDIEINEVFRKYIQSPTFVVINVQQKEALDVPVQAYKMKEEIDVDGVLVKSFEKLDSTIGASLPEEIGVEYLLRDIKDSTRSSLTKTLDDKADSIKALINRLNEIKSYLSNVNEGKIPANPVIIRNIQEIFNLLPNFEAGDLIKAVSETTNNNYLSLYLAWLMKTTVTLHKLVDNKIQLKEIDIGETKVETKVEKKEEKKEEKQTEKLN